LSASQFQPQFFLKIIFTFEKLKIAGKSRKVGVFITSGGTCTLASQQIQGLQSSALKTRYNGLAGVWQGVSQGNDASGDF